MDLVVLVWENMCLQEMSVKAKLHLPFLTGSVSKFYQFMLDEPIKDVAKSNHVHMYVFVFFQSTIHVHLLFLTDPHVAV